MVFQRKRIRTNCKNLNSNNFRDFSSNFSTVPKLNKGLAKHVRWLDSAQPGASLCEVKYFSKLPSGERDASELGLQYPGDVFIDLVTGPRNTDENYVEAAAGQNIFLEAFCCCCLRRQRSV